LVHRSPHLLDRKGARLDTHKGCADDPLEVLH